MQGACAGSIGAIMSSPDTPSEQITRLAPSPTGALHLGNARTFVVNYVLACQRNWRVLMRMEDLDGPRVKAQAVEQAFDVLEWLGLTWETPVIRQSERSDRYQNALQKLADNSDAYRCTCSRRDIELAAGAPHRDDGVTAYSGVCRGKYSSDEEAKLSGGEPAWRVRVDSTPICVDDHCAGRHEFDLCSMCGDFVIFRKQGLAAYQLAVVVDDADAGVNRIVRGDDLLDSAAMQIHLRMRLHLGPEPEYWHLPLVVGEDGLRLAKRHGNTRISYYRDLGVRRDAILGLIGYWCGVLPDRREMSMGELISMMHIECLPPEPVVFGRDDDSFLQSCR